MPKLGSEKRPAVARVKTMEKAGKILEICNRYGWKAIVGIEPDKPENISDVQKLLKRKIGRQHYRL